MAAVAKDEVRRFIVECLKTVGAPSRAALDQAELLVQADRTGHFSHGLNRLGNVYIYLFTFVCN